METWLLKQDTILAAFVCSSSQFSSWMISKNIAFKRCKSWVPISFREKISTLSNTSRKLNLANSEKLYSLQTSANTMMKGSFGCLLFSFRSLTARLNSSSLAL